MYVSTGKPLTNAGDYLQAATFLQECVFVRVDGGAL